MSQPHDWIIPDWPAPRHVRALVTTRSGGVSRGPYASFNVGLRTGDEEAAVRANRAALAALLPQEPKWLHQQHGSRVVEVDDIVQILAADASVARKPNTVCVIMVADCVPVLFADRHGTRVAAAHAGWRGLAGGILENTVEHMGVEPQEVLAYLGPGIGPEAFEVGADVRNRLLGRDTMNARAFSPLSNGKWLADLYALARAALHRAGVTQVYGGGMCTFSDPKRFYSYRRDRVTGRMAALVWREQ
jgi:YfiH family protein